MIDGDLSIKALVGPGHGRDAQALKRICVKAHIAPADADGRQLASARERDERTGRT